MSEAEHRTRAVTGQIGSTAAHLVSILRSTRKPLALPTRAATAVLVLTLLSSALPVGAARPLQGHSGARQRAIVAVQRGAFVVSGRPLTYLHGINYEGPSDRPWRMWQDGRFDATLIGRDFDAMAAAGYNPVRIFIQRPLPAMILQGDFSRLDSVVALAAARGLRLLITLNDDGDPDLRRVARVDALIAAHLAGNATVFGYDVRNEPGLVDVAASIYPAGTRLPLLSPALIAAYHERVSMAAARAMHGHGTWSGAPFEAMDARAFYYYLNAQHLLSSFLRDNPSYPAVAASPYWQRFLDLANRTLASYVGLQVQAVRAADATHVVTVGYSSRFWSALPANGALDFRSIHLYPPADYDGFHAAMRRFEALNALAASPLVLEEYGVSNDYNDRQSSAVRETAAALYLRTLGGAGDMKWMFNDDAVGYSAYENNLGAVDAHNNPKPTYLISAVADAYWARTPYAGGLILQQDPLTGAGFVFVARDALAIGGSLPYQDARVRFAPAAPGLVWLDWSTPGVLRVTSTTSGTLTLALGLLTGATAMISSPAAGAATPRATTAAPALLSAPTGSPTGTSTRSATASATASPTSTATTAAALSPGPQPSPTATITASPIAAPGGLTVTVNLQAGLSQVWRYRVGAAPPPVPIDLPAPDLHVGWYMVARGHNVASPFLAPWLALAGTSIGTATGAGLPLTETFRYHGMPTQYFDNVALRLGPHGLTTAPLGLVALGQARPRARELARGRPHLYDRATGHNVHGAFLAYVRATGGLRFWGDPLSEEMVEHGRLVQYFTGGALVLNRSPRGGVGLLPLGRRLWPVLRRVYGL